jgi:hypothetical protein
MTGSPPISFSSAAILNTASLSISSSEKNQKRTKNAKINNSNKKATEEQNKYFVTTKLDDGKI